MKFIITHKYGEKPWKWPSGENATIVLSSVNIHYTLSNTSKTSNEHHKLSRNNVYKNRSLHAEVKFLRKLRKAIDKLSQDKKVSVVDIHADLVQNYSPCNSYRLGGKSGCADDFLKFKEDMEKNGSNVSLKIKFANFYRHTDESNRAGLRKLVENGVKLELFQGEEDWKVFLNNKTKKLTKDDYRELLERATSEERTKREMDDVEILRNIISGAPGRQRKQSNILLQ